MTERKKRGSRKKKAEEEVSGGNGVDVQNTPDGVADPVFAEDHVMKLTGPELDKFNLLRLKVEGVLQAIRVNELELDKLNREFRDAQHNKEQFIRQLRGQVEPLNNVYLDYVRELAKKYKLDPQKMGIDDETGVLQDLRSQEEVEPG
jgi:hypothetical protein